MTPSQPPPAPPPVPGEAKSPLQVELEGIQAAVEGAARAADARQAAEGATRPMGVVRNPDGRIIVTGRDGRTVIIDPKVGLDEDAVQEMVQTALAPPPLPEPPRGGPSEAVQIVGIVMATILLLLLAFPLVRAYVRRQAGAGAPAAASPELAGRLARIEQAIEAVAIEVERIAESERYSARLLTERLPAAQAPARAAQPTADVPR